LPIPVAPIMAMRFSAAGHTSCQRPDSIGAVTRRPQFVVERRMSVAGYRIAKRSQIGEETAYFAKRTILRRTGFEFANGWRAYSKKVTLPVATS
jgi:hypothetical protein